MYYPSSEDWELGLYLGEKEEGADNEGIKVGWGTWKAAGRVSGSNLENEEWSHLANQ